MPNLELDGQSYEVDEEGYLMDWSVWKEGMANIMAKEDGLELSEEHWDVIKFLREYFEKYQIAPMIKILTKELKKKYGKEVRKKAAQSICTSSIRAVLQSRLVDMPGFQNQQVAYN
jgi:tRNA 2-thiouridine synthesizing protein E